MLSQCVQPCWMRGPQIPQVLRPWVWAWLHGHCWPCSNHAAFMSPLPLAHAELDEDHLSLRCGVFCFSLCVTPGLSCFAVVDMCLPATLLHVPSGGLARPHLPPECSFHTSPAGLTGQRPVSPAALPHPLSAWTDSSRMVSPLKHTAVPPSWSPCFCPRRPGARRPVCLHIDVRAGCSQCFGWAVQDLGTSSGSPTAALPDACAGSWAGQPHVLWVPLSGINCRVLESPCHPNASV